MTQMSLLTPEKPATPVVNYEDIRRDTLKTEVLAFLKARGEKGATNIELNNIQFRYGASIYELRKEGYKVWTKHVKGGVYRYILTGGPYVPNKP